MFCLHFSSTGEQVPLIKDWKDVLNKVGDNQVLLQSIKGSAYYPSFGDRATAWEAKLADLDDILNNLNSAQRKWVYLEPYQEQMKLKSPSQTGVGFDCLFFVFVYIANMASMRPVESRDRRTEF